MTTIASCRTCGAEPRADARFCDSCGSPLGDLDQRAEYKQVTVLFADVVHSMDIAATVGAERLREIMSDVFQRSSAVVNRYGGTVSQFTGDGLMAVFGAPVALEDHAFRACLAALDIQQEAQTLGATVEQRDGIELLLRVGLNSGEVIAGEIGIGPSSYTTIGEQVGMAQRMESVAAPGGVMLSESTARLVETTAALGEPEMVRIKGSDAPVAARQLIAAGSNTRLTTRQLSTLIGRDWELATVAGMLQQAMKGKGRIVGLVGPPGIGKSRLAAEISSLAAGDAIQVFTASCESHTNELPFHLATRFLRETLAIETLGEEAARANIQARMLNADPEDLVLLQDLLGIRDERTALPAIDADARRRRLAAMLNAAVVARKTPALYVIEDVHWIDEVSEAMIAEFAAVVPQTCALLLLTYRPEYRGALDCLPSSHRVALATLDSSESSTLASELLGADNSVADLVAHVADSAAGNPLFTEEIIRDLAERGVIEGAAGAYVCRRDDADLRVPATLRAAIAARVDRLSSTAKRTLNAAAVIGTRFDTDLLNNAVGGEVELHELVKAELIDRVTFTAKSEYVFRHPLIRTVAYESQLKADRSHLHRRLAATIQERDQESVDSNAALVAQHLEAAGDLRAAFDWHMRAAAWAQFRDLGAARTSWQRARDVADRLPADANKTVMQIGPRAMLCASTFRCSGSIEDAGFDELRELCLSVKDNLSLALGMAGLLTALIFHNRHGDAARVASECSATLESTNDQTLALTLSAASSNAKFQAGEVVEGLRLAQRAIDLAEGDPTREQVMVGSPLTVAITLRGANRLALGISGWRDDLDSAARMAVSIDATSHIGAIVLKYCIAIHNGASLPDAQAFAETAEALELAERCGEDFTVDSARLARGVVLANGDIAHRSAGLELLAGYRQASLRHGYATDSVRYADTETAKEKARVGDLDGAIEIGRTVVDFLFNTGDMTSRGPAVTVLVESLLRRGNQPDLAEAVAAIERLATVPIDPGFVLHELPLLRMRALLARVRGDEDGYADFVRRYRAMANDLGFEGHMALAATMG